MRLFTRWSTRRAARFTVGSVCRSPSTALILRSEKWRAVFIGEVIVTYLNVWMLCG
jgi:hypothetical protein